jgi:hypothetical protein
MAVGERAAAFAEASKIEAQAGDAMLGQRQADPPRAVRVGVAGEAMREQRNRADAPGGQFESARQHVPGGTRKFDVAAHHLLPVLPSLVPITDYTKGAN